MRAGAANREECEQNQRRKTLPHHRMTAGAQERQGARLAPLALTDDEVDLRSHRMHASNARSCGNDVSRLDGRRERLLDGPEGTASSLEVGLRSKGAGELEADDEWHDARVERGEHFPLG